MNNKNEVNRWKKDAYDYLKEAERAFSEKSFRSTTQNAQLCIETSCKAIISYFSEPWWTHSPGKQLLKILKEIEFDVPENLFLDLKMLAEDADYAGPWHGLSTYGEVRRGVHYSAVDICNEEIAKDLLRRAKKAYKTLENFWNFIQ